MAIAIRSNGQISYLFLCAGAFTAALAVRETGPAVAPKPRLLDQVREAIAARHYSHRTEKAYIHWIKRYVFFHGKRHPSEMSAAEVTAFLTFLAVHDNVAASTQNQALSALFFLYREVLGVELPWLDDVIRARRPQHLPVVLPRDQVRAVLQRLDGVSRLMALLLYGAGLRLLECCHLRVKDIDFGTDQIVIRDGKGRTDRVTMLPAAAKATLIAHLERGRSQYLADLRHGAGWVELPHALTRKYPNAGRDWGWQWVFPATRFYVERLTGQRRRHHLHESVLQRAVKTQSGAPALLSTPHATPSAIPLPPTCWKRATTSARYKTARPLKRQHHDDLHPRSQSRAGRGPQPRRPDVPVMILSAKKDRDRHGLAGYLISCSGPRCITARKRLRSLQGRVNEGADLSWPCPFVALSRTTLADIAVQDTER